MTLILMASGSATWVVAYAAWQTARALVRRGDRRPTSMIRAMRAARVTR